MSKEKTLGVALVGYGFMGETHLKAWSYVDGGRVVGVWGRDDSKARRLVTGAGAKTYPKFDDALKDSEVDIVDICTPTHTHRDFSIAALDAGKHVFLEKPLALSLEQADEIIDAAKRNRGKKVMVGQVQRFFAGYTRTKELIEQGSIGEPVISRAFRGGPLPDWGKWFRDLDKSGGVAVDLAIHDVDFLTWCYGKPVRRVYAKVRRLVHRDMTAHDYAIINMRFEGGGIAFVEASWAIPRDYPFSTNLNIDGTRGTLHLDSQETIPVRVFRGSDAVETFAPETLPWSTRLGFPVDAFSRELREFVRCITENEKPAIDGRAAKRSLEVCLAAVKSSEKGKAVTLPMEPD